MVCVWEERLRKCVKKTALLEEAYECIRISRYWTLVDKLLINQFYQTFWKHFMGDSNNKLCSKRYNKEPSGVPPQNQKRCNYKYIFFLTVYILAQLPIEPIHTLCHFLPHMTTLDTQMPFLHEIRKTQLQMILTWKHATDVIL